MKNKILTAICAIMIPIPWTILAFRQYDWALKSPTAEIMINAYAVFMIFSGLFTVWAYQKQTVQNTLMKVCLVFNCIYAAGGLAALAMIYLPKLIK